MSYADVLLREDMSALLLVLLFMSIIKRIRVDRIARDATIATTIKGP